MINNNAQLTDGVPNLERALFGPLIIGGGCKTPVTRTSTRNSYVSPLPINKKRLKSTTVSAGDFAMKTYVQKLDQIVFVFLEFAFARNVQILGSFELRLKENDKSFKV